MLQSAYDSWDYILSDRRPISTVQYVMAKKDVVTQMNQDPMRDEGPGADPSYEGEEVDAIRDGDVVDCVGEDSDGSGYADDDGWLCG